MDIVIVESPAKAKTINKYLGSDARVFASFGHIRDLPERDGSVDPDADFAMEWELQGDAAKRLNEIAVAMKSADRLVLATDPDREGEAISWHVCEVLRNKKVLVGKPVCRVVFNAITRNAVLEAMASPREVDTDLVDAYLARRALDYLVGFQLSPVLWRKLPGARSAGRVQSVALRLVCDREFEIEAHRAREYWSVDAKFTTESATKLPARLVRLDSETLQKFSLADVAAAEHARATIEEASFTITKIEKKPEQRRPSPPFTTSTLQQEAARKLGFSARQTMQIAQKLYEGIPLDGETTGLITYMRTDGLDIASEALTALRHVIVEDYGNEYLPDAPRRYNKTAVNAQEAHEAIRPTVAIRRPDAMARYLERDAARLYELIWKRAMASQMPNTQAERTTITIDSTDQKTGLRATGTVIIFPGFLALYEESGDDESDSSEPDKDTDNPRLPRVREGGRLTLDAVTPEQHFTQPPPRYTEATLVKKMEALGIGRPSTYASTLSVLSARDYVQLEKKRFIPQDKGRLVIAFLENFFARYVEYDFTADLEADLDRVSNGEVEYREVLLKFWRDFKLTIDATMELRNTDVLNRMNDVLGTHVFGKDADGNTLKTCPLCNEGELSLKTGRYGAFVGCTRYPDCTFTRPFSDRNGEATTNAADAANAANAANADRQLGIMPETDNPIILKSGRFGPYLEAGKNAQGKPHRVSIPKPMTPETITLEDAIKLLSLPREIGTHPETGDMITAELGRFGPYLRAGKQSASLEKIEDLFDIGINRSVSVLADRQKNRTRGNRQISNNVIKNLGEHPDNSTKIEVLNGRYGPYIKNGKVNATIPKGEDPESITLERACEIIAERKTRPTSNRKKTKTRRQKPATRDQ